jgi:hypothetical protein
MLYAMLEASDLASCYRVYFTKNATNTKDSTQPIELISIKYKQLWGEWNDFIMKTKHLPF